MGRLAVIAVACVFLAPLVVTDESLDVSLRKELLADNSIEDHSALRSNGLRAGRRIGSLFRMIKCATGCSPFKYLTYGCYCGLNFSKPYSGPGVDDIDNCCKAHDACYTQAACSYIYFQPYKWKCNKGDPSCSTDSSSCGLKKCKCDETFTKCLKNYPCPKYTAIPNCPA